MSAALVGEPAEMVTELDVHNIGAQEWTRMHVCKKVEGGIAAVLIQTNSNYDVAVAYIS